MDKADLPPKKGPLIFGVDLGQTLSMSCVSPHWPETGRLQFLGAFPRMPDLATRGQRDGQGSIYSEMAAEGHLVTLGSRTVPVDELLTEAVSRFGEPDLITCDRFRQGELLDALQAAEINVPVVWRGMGFRDGASDVRGFRQAVADEKVSAERCLLMRSAMGEAVTVSDPAGNQKLSKMTDGSRARGGRDDAAASSILAVAEGQRVMANYRPSPIYMDVCEDAA